MAKRPERQGVMLCQHANQGRVERLAYKGYVLSQPKYNGERGHVEWFHDEPVLLSSYGNIFYFLDHIKNELMMLPKTARHEYDGELYKHGWSRQKIHSLISRDRNHPGPDVEGIQFHIFDIRSDLIQATRLAQLSVVFDCFWDDTYALQQVPTRPVDIKEWTVLAGEYIDQGYEGAVLRSPTGMYIPKKGVHMLKFKPTEEDIYTIIGVTEAISQEGERKGMVGAFMVRDSDNRVFKVGAGKLPHAKRIDYWEHRNRLLERPLLVKHELIPTDGGIPVSAVAVKVK